VQLRNASQRPLGSLPVKLVSQNKHSCVAISDHAWFVEQRNKRIVIKPLCILESDYVAAITSLPSEDGYQNYAAVIDQKLCMICLDPREDINMRTTRIGEVCWMIKFCNFHWELSISDSIHSRHHEEYFMTNLRIALLLLIVVLRTLVGRMVSTSFMRVSSLLQSRWLNMKSYVLWLVSDQGVLCSKVYYAQHNSPSMRRRMEHSASNQDLPLHLCWGCCP
jgi:hypothetical protein